MKLQASSLDWDTHKETIYLLELSEAQIASLASGAVPHVVKAMCEDVLHFRDQDEAHGKAAESAATRRRTRRA